MNRRAFEVWNTPGLTRAQKAKKLNKEFNKKWDERTWQQRAKLYGEGYKAGIEDQAPSQELERLVNKEAKILIQQKKNTAIKAKLHKDARELSGMEIFKEAIKEYQPLLNIEPIAKRATHKKGTKLIEYIIADLHYKGGKEEQKHVNQLFHRIFDDLGKIDPNAEYRLSFLGDDIEGMSAHDSQLMEIIEGSTRQTLEVSQLYVSNINQFFKRVGKAKKSVAFVPYSNHGLSFGQKKARYQFVNEDYGMFILESLLSNLDKDIHVFPVDSETFSVITDKDIYTHGHQGFMKNHNSMFQVYGVNRDIHSAHLHHFEVMEYRNATHTKYPTARSRKVDYERMAGYDSTPQITKREVGNGYKTIKTIDIY